MAPKASFAAGASAAAGLIVAACIAWRWFAPSSTASFLGGFLVFIAAPIAAIAGVVALRGWAAMARPARAMAVVGMLLGVVGMAFVGGAIPHDVVPRELRIIALNGPAEPVNATIELSRDGRVVQTFPLTLAPGAHAVLRTQRLAPGPYALTVQLPDGGNATETVYAHWASFEVTLTFREASVVIRQGHGD